MQRDACGIILAGGLGTRLRGLYPGLPKPMVPAAGKPFLEWVLRHLASQGVTRFVVALHHLADVAEAYLAGRPRDSLEIRTIREPSPLGTGGAVLWAQRAAPAADVLVVANGDSLVFGDFREAWTELQRDDVDGLLVGVPAIDASRFGTLEQDGSGWLTGFREKRAGSGWVNAGIYFLKRRLLARFPRQVPSSMEEDVFPALLAAGARLKVLASSAPFLDIGTPESVCRADEFVRRCFLQGAAA
jgi:D-glycero-alpha-D-manno-heptose 1-phosphate guanylyltransferase